MLRVMSKLLMPAPGTGAASQALRSLFAATGLLRYPESASYTSGPPAIAYEAGNVYNAKGKDLLMQTASSGLGETYRSEYGVLKALLELMNSSSGFIDRLDGKARATVAVFIQRLAANTIRKTSQAVNEYLKEVSEVDGSTRGGSFADEMLFRILDFVASGAADSSSWLSIDWSNIAELAGACISLSALHVHIFPESELHRPSRRGFHDSGPDKEDLISSPKSLNGAPSPYELFRLIVFISSHVPRDVVFKTFRSWYSLLGIRAIIETTNHSPAPIPIFLELTSTLLNALANADTSNEMALLVRKDGGFIACSAVLTCVKYICEWANPHSSEHKLIGEAQVTDLLAGIIAAASGLVGSGLDTSRARTMLYTSFLQVAPVARKIVSDEGLARAFGGRVGARQVSGSEGLIASCCLDSVGCPSPATKAVSLATACMVTLMDPVRSVPALSAQNRLRRIVATSIADVDARSLIARACNRSGAEMKASDPEMSRERAAKVVGEAALSLVHAVSTALNGHRALVDSGCVEAVAGLLMFLESSRLGNIMAENQSMQRFGSSSVDANGSIINVGEDNMDVANDSFYLYGASGPGERRASLIASISSAVAAALICPDSALVEGAFDLLEKGHGCFTAIFRMLRSGRPAYLEALSSLSLILSRIPPKLFIAAGDPYLLRFSLAGALHVFVTPRTDSRNIESTISNLRIGFASRQPSNRNEVLRSKVLHPYGGSIFDRDIVDERISCLHSIMAALRPQCGNVFLFEATLETSTGSRGFGVWQTLLHLIGSLTTKSLLLNYWMFFVSLVPCGKMFDDTPKKVFRQEQQAMRTR